jgi:hypothetical protein
MSRALAISNELKRKSTVTVTEATGNVINLPAPKNTQKIQLSHEALKRKAAIEKREAEVTNFIKEQSDKLKKIRSGVIKSQIKYRDSLYKSLSGIYASYIDIENSDHSGKFYANLRGYLLDQDIRIQSNSTEVSLAIRYVYGSSIKPKTVNDYGNALLEACLQEVTPKEFLEWLKQTTISKASQQYQQRAKVGLGREALINRARILILRMMDVFETQPIATFEMPAWQAEKKVHAGSDLVFLVARGVRRFDRESHIADIRVCFFIPPGIDFEHMVINRLARHIYNGVLDWEEQLEKVEEHVWAGDLYNYLSDKEAQAAEKSHTYWQERMAASMDLDRVSKERSRQIS